MEWILIIGAPATFDQVCLINFLSIPPKPCHRLLLCRAAILDPGHPKQIGKKEAGQVYIDDFEGTRAGLDLRFPLISWTMASVPQGNNGPGGAN